MSFKTQKFKTFKLTIILACLLGLVCPSAQSSGDANAGQQLVQQKCLACHNINGSGSPMVSDLAKSYASYEQSWLRTMIQNPGQLLASDPIAKKLLVKYNNIPMPSLGLSDSEVDDIMAFLQSLATGAPTQNSAQANSHSSHSSPGTNTVETKIQIPEGNAAIGEQLFDGRKPFQNKASSCIACHHVASSNPFGGGTLGTDLSKTISKFGETGTYSMLQQLPFPSMKPIYDKKPLTAEEQADLLAYFKSIQDKENQTTQIPFLLLTFVGLLIVLVLIQIIWHDRFSKSGSVREEFLKKHKGDKN